MGLFDSIGNMFSSFLNPGDAYKKAMQEAQRGYKESIGYQKPFLEHGLEQYPMLSEQLKKLLNPAGLQSEWAEGYKESPYAKRLEQLNTGQGMEAASQMGLLGSSAALNNIQQGAGDIVSKDRQQYLNDLMQKYMAGLGLSSDIYGGGRQAGNSLADRAFQHGQNLAGLKFGQESAPGDLLGRLLGGVGGHLLNSFLPIPKAQ